MCDEKIRLSIIASTINATLLPDEFDQPEMIERQAAANQAVAEHVAGCAECQELAERQRKAAGRVAEFLLYEDREVAQS